MRPLFLFLSLLLLLACTPLPPVTPTPQPKPASLPVDALVTPLRFTRSGGIAGTQMQLDLAVDGSYTVQTMGVESGSGQISDDDFGQIAAALAASNLFDADHDFPAVGADLFTYTLAYNGYTLTAQDGALPDALLPLLARLLPLLDRG